MSLSVVFRRAARRDLSDIKKIQDSAFSGAAYGPFFLRREETFNSYLKETGSTLMVADVTGSGVSGYALLTPSDKDNTGVVDMVAVADDFKGKGLAKGLLLQVEYAARDIGYAVLELEAHETNKSAMGLYKAMGYKCVGHIKHYYNDGGKAVCYAKKISGEMSQPQQNRMKQHNKLATLRR